MEMIYTNDKLYVNYLTNSERIEMKKRLEKILESYDINEVIINNKSYIGKDKIKKMLKE